MKYFIPLIILLSACGKSPKVVMPEANETVRQDAGSGIFQPDRTPQPASSEAIHQVIVKEALPTTRYVYLRVEENGKEFWIATNKTEVTVGNTYVYQGGLLKTNFESQEYGRTFDEIYLVSRIMSADHGQTTQPPKEEKPVAKVEVKKANKSGSMAIVELVKNAKSLSGQTVQLTGTVTKINANIMSRNWIHLEDGTQGDFDLVITTDFQVPLGHEITIQGIVTLDKDFGAGYYYDLIIENGTLVR